MRIKGGRLNKTKKVSCTAEIMDKAKESPGIGKYKWAKPFEIRGHSRQRSRKIGFIDEVNAISKEIPGHKYKIDYSKIMDRAPDYSFRKINKDKEKKESGSFIRNENGVLVNTKVGPAKYKCEDSFLKTQVICKNKLVFNKNKEKRYFDQIIDKKKFIPGVGWYKNIEKAFKSVTRPSTAKVKAVGGR